MLPFLRCGSSTTVIKMHEAGQEVVQQNCRNCHATLNAGVGLLAIGLEEKRRMVRASCAGIATAKCHTAESRA
ncbi:MAG: hypothetical protein U5K79_25725 [Cyclobacteriaceae bacterium]|nr:hypothetical protein [Cyclobacteriaceae bacterium]